MQKAPGLFNCWPASSDLFSRSNAKTPIFFLCICTPEYQRRIEGAVPPEKGRGVYWEGSLLDDELYDAKGNRRIVPILFDDEPESTILDFLRGWTFCRLSQFELTDSGYEPLIRILTGKARVERNALGVIPDLPIRHAPAGPAAGWTHTGVEEARRIDAAAPAGVTAEELFDWLGRGRPRTRWALVCAAVLAGLSGWWWMHKASAVDHEIAASLMAMHQGRYSDAREALEKLSQNWMGRARGAWTLKKARLGVSLETEGRDIPVEQFETGVKKAVAGASE